LIEEKTDSSMQRAWTVTRRLATQHEDRPWGWRVTCHTDGEFSVMGARNGESHESFGERRIPEPELVAWIGRVFDQHYAEQAHPKTVAA
jgi:hypothetical protein